MVIMDVKIDNFYGFRDFHVNFSYPKKIVGSNISEENLKGFPNFRYKKINIIMGANATGKTTFGHMLRDIFNFIDKKNYNFIFDSINDVSREASFSIDMICGGEMLYRVTCKILPLEKEFYDEKNLIVQVDSTKIATKDSYETCVKKIVKNKEIHSKNYIEELEKVENLYWLFEHPLEVNRPLRLPKGDELFIKVLRNILMSLDPAIKSVDRLHDVDDAYVIRLDKKTIIIQDGEVFATNLLSSGTKAGVEVSKVLSALIQGSNSFYYCDEKFSYIHSDIEKAVLGVMIEMIKPNEQLFFTTHNTDILEMDLPKHSFVFMKKERYGDENSIHCLSAGDFLKRNTDSLRKAVENDLFSVAPSTDKIFEIESFVYRS